MNPATLDAIKQLGEFLIVVSGAVFGYKVHVDARTEKERYRQEDINKLGQDINKLRQDWRDFKEEFYRLSQRRR